MIRAHPIILFIFLLSYKPLTTSTIPTLIFGLIYMVFQFLPNFLTAFFVHSISGPNKICIMHPQFIYKIFELLCIFRYIFFYGYTQIRCFLKNFSTMLIYSSLHSYFIAYHSMIPCTHISQTIIHRMTYMRCAVYIWYSSGNISLFHKYILQYFHQTNKGQPYCQPLSKITLFCTNPSWILIILLAPPPLLPQSQSKYIKFSYPFSSSPEPPPYY